MKRHLAALLMSAAALSLLCGCGYRIGTMGHPQIHTIAIAPVKNDTTVYNLAWILRNVLVEQFMLDGTLKAVDEKKADCILYARIVSSTVRVVSEKHKYDRSSGSFEPDEWAITVNAEYSVIIPGQKKPLIPLRTVSGSANYQSPGDVDAARRRAASQACREAAQEIVEFTTEAW